MEYFAPYLISEQFMERTDHNALKWIKNYKQPKGQVARWIERLSIFDFKIEHRKGRKHGNAEGVSRIPREETATKENKVCEYVVYFMISISGHLEWVSIIIRNVLPRKGPAKSM